MARGCDHICRFKLATDQALGLRGCRDIPDRDSYAGVLRALILSQN
jgi:hypothetical protein